MVMVTANSSRTLSSTFPLRTSQHFHFFSHNISAKLGEVSGRIPHFTRGETEVREEKMTSQCYGLNVSPSKIHVWKF